MHSWITFELTRSAHRLATHDENDLHWSELRQPHRTTTMYCESQFAAEDRRRYADTNDKEDDCCGGQSDDAVELPCCQMLDSQDIPADVENQQAKMSASNDDRHESIEDVDGMAPWGFERAADDADLECKRHFDDDEQHVADYLIADGDDLCAVLALVVVCFEPVPIE